MGTENGRSLPGRKVKLLTEEVQGGVPVAVRVGMHLRLVGLELLPLARVLGHAVCPPVLEINLSGQVCLYIIFLCKVNFSPVV